MFKWAFHFLSFIYFGLFLSTNHINTKSMSSTVKIIQPDLNGKLGMGGIGRIEVNLVRLLSRCESMAFGGLGSSCNWRLEKYILTLQDYLSQLRKMFANGPSRENLMEYTRRVDLLHGIIKADKLPTASEKSLAVDMLAPSKNTTTSVTGSLELHTQTKAKYNKEMRDELLGKTSEIEANQLKHRKAAGFGDDGTSPEEDVDALLKYHNKMQERLADEMIHLARSLKENTEAAGRIVRDDKEKVVDSSRLADSNFSRLKVESERLEYHVQKACSWWIWLMLIAVIVTFVWMVIFMKMFPKK